MLFDIRCCSCLLDTIFRKYPKTFVSLFYSKPNEQHTIFVIPEIQRISGRNISTETTNSPHTNLNILNGVYCAECWMLRLKLSNSNSLLIQFGIQWAFLYIKSSNHFQCIFLIASYRMIDAAYGYSHKIHTQTYF